MNYRRWLLAFCLLAVPLPAFANNPPRPDGMLGLILLFPVAILGLRLAGVRPGEKSKARRLVTGLILGFAFLMSMAGTEIGALGMLVLLSYGLHRGARAIVRGQGAKRFAVGAGVILFALFASANYVVSLNYYPSVGRNESSAVVALRTIAVSQTAFQGEATLDANRNGVGEYGTLEQLADAGLINSHNLLGSAERRGYRVTLELAGDPTLDERRYFVSAVPLHYGWYPMRLSLAAGLWPDPPYARRTFAVDESGVIRSRDLDTARPVTREETQKWNPLD